MISIVIPTFNRLTSLKRCLESIIVQAYGDLEVVVVDDFSTDSSRDYLRHLASEHAFIKVILNRENKGVNYTRNRGIEAATKKFILFLDSDDEMMEGSLSEIQNTMKAHAAIKHFLFIVSDRADEYTSMTAPVNVKYEDWLTGKITGDFTHVVLSSVMKKYLFFEEFRLYEYLNWLRLQKETSPQLLVPVVTTSRDRERSDSLTHSSILRNSSAIKAKFEAEKLFYSLYHKDLSLYSPGSLSSRLIETIMLGVAACRRSDCRSLIQYADKFHVKMLGNTIMMLPSSLIEYGIIQYSNYKRRSFNKA